VPHTICRFCTGGKISTWRLQGVIRVGSEGVIPVLTDSMRSWLDRPFFFILQIFIFKTIREKLL